MTEVYFLLGTPGSGRRAIIRDLIQNGLDESRRSVVLVAESEPVDPVDEKLAALSQVEVRRWKWNGPEFPTMDLPADGAVFLMADTSADPIDQLEALKPWLQQHDAQLARIFCVVHCQLAEKHSVLRQWFSALIHFADVVFLTRREGVENKWLSEFIKHFTDEYYPCHFVQVRNKGDLSTPALWLDPTPRRVSQYFEEGEICEIEGLETDDEEPLSEEDTGLLAPEVYFVRDLSGRRSKEVPDVRALIRTASQKAADK